MGQQGNHQGGFEGGRWGSHGTIGQTNGWKTGPQPRQWRQRGKIGAAAAIQAQGYPKASPSPAATRQPGHALGKAGGLCYSGANR